MKILIREIDETLKGDERKQALREAKESMMRSALLQAHLLRDADGNLIGQEDMASRESTAIQEAALLAPLPTAARAEYGKPYLPDLPEFHYSISHSGRYVVLAAIYPDTHAITPSAPAEIGIDIQKRGPVQMGIDAVAARYFTPGEAGFLAHFDEKDEKQREMKQHLFYQYWSIKEAYLKCTGQGLTGGLDSFDMESCDCMNDSGVIRDHSSGRITARFLMITPPDPEYVMAVCVQQA